MKNITVQVSDAAYHRARVWAARHESSLSRIVQYLIENLPGILRAARAFPADKLQPKEQESAPSAPLSLGKPQFRQNDLTGKPTFRRGCDEAIH